MLVNPPLGICSDVIDFLWINHKKELKCNTAGIIKFIDKTPAYVKKAISFLTDAKIVIEEGDKLTLSESSIEKLKQNVFRAESLLVKALIEHEAFKEYNLLLSNGKSEKISARTVKTLYNINLSEDEIISSFMGWLKFIETNASKETGLSSPQGNNVASGEKQNRSIIKDAAEYIGRINRDDYIGVITASPDEFNSIKSLLTNVAEQKIDAADSVSYHIGTLEGNGKKFRVVLPYPLDMGVASAVITTTKTIANFHPKYLFMVGVACGNKKVNKIGDILIAEKSLNYNEVVEIERKDKSTVKKFMQNPDSINKHLKTQLSQFADSDIIKKIESSYDKKDNVSTTLKCSIGLLVTGSSLMRSQTKVEEINETYHNVIGLDMETSGFYYASAHCLKQDAPYFVSIKSVSDFGDNDNHGLPGPERKKYALHTSSNAFKSFVLNFISPL